MELLALETVIVEECHFVAVRNSDRLSIVIIDSTLLHHFTVVELRFFEDLGCLEGSRVTLAVFIVIDSDIALDKWIVAIDSHRADNTPDI